MDGPTLEQYAKTGLACSVGFSANGADQVKILASLRQRSQDPPLENQDRRVARAI